MSTASAPTAYPPTTPLENGDVLYEVIDGQRVEKHVSKLVTLVGTLVGHHLNTYSIPKNIGVAVVEGLVRLQPDGDQFRPDVMFIPYERWVEDEVTDKEPWELVPTLMVEVISPTNGFDEILDKVDEYFAGGVPLVWVIHPGKRRAWVFGSPMRIEVVFGDGVLTGGTGLPQFQLSLSELFAAISRPKT